MRLLAATLLDTCRLHHLPNLATTFLIWQVRLLAATLLEAPQLQPELATLLSPDQPEV